MEQGAAAAALGRAMRFSLKVDSAMVVVCTYKVSRIYTVVPASLHSHQSRAVSVVTEVCTTTLWLLT